MSSIPRPITPSRGGPNRPAGQQHSRSNSGVTITVPTVNNNNTISPSPGRFPRNNNNNNNNQPQNGGTGQQQQQIPPQRDPFVSLEDETEKSLHILNQLRDRHRQIVAKIPEVADSSRLRSAQQPTASSGGNPNDPNSASSQPSTMTTAKPSAVEWHSVPVQLLVELDEITEQTDELITDASQDIELLKATVQKHVDGAAFDAVVELDSDEISRRVEIVHAFERKLRQSRNELQNMVKAKDFRQMQLGDYATAYYEKKNKGLTAETPLKGNYSNNNKNGGVASPQPNSGETDRPANEFAANYIKQEMEEQNRISAQHAIIIDQIHMGIMSAEDKAKLINVALKESEQKLGFVDKQIDNIQNRLDSALQGLNRLLESTSERNKMIIICVLTFVLILLLLALFSGSSSSSS